MSTNRLQFSWINADEIRPNPFQPRERIDREALKKLATSIKESSLIQPIIVRKHGKGYQIIAGERRWRALQIAGMKRVPAIIKDVAEKHVLLISLIENLHRQDLKDYERENAIYELWKNKKALGFERKSELANAIGIMPKDVENDIAAWEFRRKEGRIPPSTPTYIISRTEGLPVGERRSIIEKVQSGKMQAQEAYTAIKVLRKAPEPIRRELLRPKSAITPTAARIIVEKLPSQKEQEIVLKEAKQYRLTEDEIEDRVRDIRRATERGVTPTVERATVVQGQWLLDRIRKPAEELLTLNIDSFTELTEEQRQQTARILRQLEARIAQWLQRLGAVRVIRPEKDES